MTRMTIQQARKVAENPHGFWALSQEREAFAILDAARSNMRAKPMTRFSDGQRAQMIWDRVGERGDSAEPTDADLDAASEEARKEFSKVSAYLPADPEAHPMSGRRGEY